MQESKRSGNGWIGWVVFFLLIFGSRILPPLATWLTQLTGITITAPMLIAALIALTVVSSLVGGAARQIGRARASTETRLPLPPPLNLPQSQPSRPTASASSQPTAPIPPYRTPTGLPPTMSSSRLPPPRLPSGEQKLPGPPKFEPIIDPRILSFGILGLLVLGGFFFVALALGTP